MNAVLGLLLLAAPTTPLFTRHVEAVFSKLGCNGGTCHGAVRGQNGFSLSLFGADPALDHAAILRGGAGRRFDRFAPEESLLLRKATGRVAHGGGVVLAPNSDDFALLRKWLGSGAEMDAPEQSRVTRLVVGPARHVGGKPYSLKVEATYADGSAEDVTALCSFAVQDGSVATVSADGRVQPATAGETAIVVRYRAEPALTLLTVPRDGATVPDVDSHNFVDVPILAKLKRLGLPAAGLADDATFLRRASLDTTAGLPSPDEVRAFLADARPDKRERKIDELLARPGHAALWTLKFCDLLKATDFGVYADGMRQEVDAPRFQAWVRARMDENTPYDEFVERILTATSRDGRSPETWAEEIVSMEEGYSRGRPDLATYRQRRSLDLYWQRQSSTGVDAALQVAHAFLGLRLECARCHRHPHDAWQQDDLLSFANFFMPVRKIGFGGENEKRFPEIGAIFKKLNADAKQLEEKVKKERAANKKPNVTERERLAMMDRKAKLMGEAARRIMHSEVRILPKKSDASVTSPLGTQSSKRLRLLGHTEETVLPEGADPRKAVMDWMRSPKNPWFARAIVNRVWAHYFGRGLVDPPDDLSVFNPPSHPELLDALRDGFVASGFDLRWLHRAILRSRTYQQASGPDGAHYAAFAYRRLPAESLLDAIDTATGTREKLGMEYYHWPEQLTAVEIPYAPKNAYVAFMLSHFGKPKRNAAVQCDCERDGHASALQVLSLANHPRIRAKIAEESGRIARLMKEIPDDARRVEEVFLATVSRLPTSVESAACLAYVKESATPAKGFQGVLWSLLNTREFVLQH